MGMKPISFWVLVAGAVGASLLFAADDKPSPPQREHRSQQCHPSYAGECVPITSDVDCLGGKGNGPAYVGRVLVVGPDVYGLDRDNDGVGCERSPQRWR